MRVLLLEDDDYLRMAFEHALEDLGHDVVACSSNEEAMAHLRHSSAPADLILLDLQIGDATSLSVAEFAAYAAPNTRVVVITGSELYPHGELHSRGMNVAWTLRKPVRMNDLQALVQFEEQRLGESASPAAR